METYYVIEIQRADGTSYYVTDRGGGNFTISPKFCGICPEMKFSKIPTGEYLIYLSNAVRFEKLQVHEIRNTVRVTWEKSMQ